MKEQNTKEEKPISKLRIEKPENHLHQERVRQPRVPKHAETPRESEPHQPEINRLQQQVGNRAVQKMARNPEGLSNHLQSATPIQRYGNRAVQRMMSRSMMAQRAANQPAAVEDDVAKRINSARGGGQTLDPGVQNNMEAKFGTDFSNVRVHTSKEAGQLNQDLNARAFTTGQDIFFKEGQYQPGSSSGQELIAHELAHVVQQSEGRVNLGGPAGGSGMVVNAPGDPYEKEADQIAQRAMSPASSETPVQRQDMPEEEEVQMQEEEELQMQEEEEEEIQMQEEEEEEIQMQEEEEELQMQEEEEELQMQEEEEEEAHAGM